MDVPKESSAPISQRLGQWFLLWLTALAVVGFGLVVEWVQLRYAPPWYERTVLVTILGFGLWRYWRLGRRFEIRMTQGGLPLLVFSSLMVSLGILSSVFKIFALSYVALITALLWTTYGADCARYWSPILLFSLTLVGVPEGFRTWLSFKLQLVSTALAAMLAGVAIPISASGNRFFIREKPFEVGAACSGMNMWEAVMFGILLWHMFRPLSSAGLAVLLAGAIFVAALLNGLRLCITALVAYWVSPEAGIAIHSNLEYLIFPLGVVFLWVVGQRFNEKE